MKYTDNQTAVCQTVCVLVDNNSDLPWLRLCGCNHVSLAVLCSVWQKAQSPHLRRVVSTTFVHAANYACNLSRPPANTQSQPDGPVYKHALQRPLFGILVNQPHGAIYR